MSVVKIKDKTFKTSIPEAQILERVKAVAERINTDMADKNPLLLAMLNGSFVFAADLMREITVPCEISFVKMSSYQGTSSTGKVKQLLGLNEDIKGRTVIIVEDIVESGLTLKTLLETLKEKEPADVQICTLLFKPDCLQVPLDIKYVAMEIPNDFILGYGLDYDQQGRNLRDIYTVVE
ncbi:hypoxanthine phosphoribosyltransferase [uncultured Prevotella sp.]|uniref:hypoxanthine phosphoribosyltransferase n=1 Tax=uncultured Prevotella sp. TaxID=159272 RepID=UPI0027E3A9FA|nr:hypoxanthine phosphoribosyltransferase [uncultured Prevotella sp.]